MATLRIGTSGSTLMPRLSSTVLSSTFRFGTVYSRQLSLPALPSLVLSVPASLQWNLPSLPSWTDIWESILRAVPKKKTSHAKKRHRQMAGKALKDVTSLCKCPACGQTKRMHYLCPHCLEKLKELGRTIEQEREVSA
ncbi:hypothetical protein DL546_004401 [Coniochaeta pulveracea]|uniref:Large ribosomal subunit protein bL32m n=1 Tax=Coniochaeta pulveracea TaxID=177199 RepID=A0A420Y0D1_9PEZI|nr:hypothetical protein DL546_004401 [Coniochaeta pulveracea]